MTDNVIDGASAPAADSAPLKSSDTSNGVHVPRVSEPEPKPEPKPEKQMPAPKLETESQQEPDGDAGEDDDAPGADSADDKPEGKSRWKKRLERVRRAAYAEAEARIREDNAQHKPEPVIEPAQDRTLADFDFDHDAYTAYKVDQAIDRRERDRVAADERKQQAEAADKFKAKIEAFEEKEGEGAWHEIVSSPINTDPKFKPLCDLFVGDDHDLAIALELANDLPEAERLLSLSPLARVREMSKLAEKFSDAPKAPVTPPKKLTNAPPPPKTVAGAGKSTVDIDDPNLSTAQRIAEWKRRGK